eukprot:1043370-Pyramimonas_sp.AAC.1
MGPACHGAPPSVPQWQNVVAATLGRTPHGARAARPSCSVAGLEVDTKTNFGGVPRPREADPDLGDG